MRKAKVVLVVRQEQLQKFQDLEFMLDPGAHPGPIYKNNRVVSKTFEVTAGLPFRFLEGLGLVFMGSCRQTSASNSRIEEDYLLVSDGQTSRHCPAHGYQPCVPFDDDNKLDSDDLRIAAEFIDCRERAEIHLHEMAA